MKTPKQQYTLELKQLVVKRIQSGEGYDLVANELGMSSQTLRYWVKASNEGRLLIGDALTMAWINLALRSWQSVLWRWPLYQTQGLSWHNMLNWSQG